MSNSIVSELFSFQGRVNRAGFARIFGLQVVVYGVVEVALIKSLGGLQAIAAAPANVLTSLPAGAMGALGIFGFIMLWISCANHTKRLHDFGWSGWMQIAPIGIYLGSLLVGLLGVGSAKGLIVGGLVAILGMSGAGLFGLAILAMYFFRKGTEGSNRYGDPQGPGDGGGEWTRQPQLATAFVKPAPEDRFARPAYGSNVGMAGESQRAAYRTPRDRPAAFGRRGAA
jgi:uncharacterized membrane protein YhaH (DUF805 family)